MSKIKMKRLKNAWGTFEAAIYAIMRWWFSAARAN